MTSYLTNEDIPGGVERLRGGGSHNSRHKAGDVADQELHDAQVVHHGDEWAGENDDGQHLG